MNIGSSMARIYNKSASKMVIPIQERNDVVRTPLWLVKKMVEWAKLTGQELVLDPCAGDNRILAYIRFQCNWERPMYAIEPNEAIESFYNLSISQKDFYATRLEIKDNTFDVVIMNPPFSHNQAYRFVEELLTNNWLSANGRIITIMPMYSLNNGELRKWFLNRHLSRLAFLPKDTFAPQVPVLHGVLAEFRMVPNPNNEWYLFED